MTGEVLIDIAVPQFDYRLANRNYSRGGSCQCSHSLQLILGLASHLVGGERDGRRGAWRAELLLAQSMKELSYRCASSCLHFHPKEFRSSGGIGALRISREEENTFNTLPVQGSVYCNRIQTP